MIDVELLLLRGPLCFCLIAILTVINIFNLRPFVRYCRAEETIRKKLFAILIVEIVACCLSGASAYILSSRKQLAVAQADFQMTRKE